MSGGLAFDAVTLRLDGKAVLDGLTAILPPGQVIGLIGPNGAGKTSLIRCALGLVEPSSGQIQIDGQALAGFSPRQRAQRLAYHPQGAAAHWPMPAERVVALGRQPHLSPWQAPRQADRDAIETAMRETDCWQFRGRAIGSLSGGEQARVLLARALAQDTTMLLADEPVAGLDPAQALALMAVLRLRAQAGRGVIVALHDLILAQRFCDRLLLLDRGKLAADGPPLAVLTPQRIETVYAAAPASLTGPEGMPLSLPWSRRSTPE